MEKERFKELCFLYFNGTIEQDDLAELKSALEKKDDELRKIYFDTKRLIEHLPLAAAPVKPPRRIKEKILREIKKESPNGDNQKERFLNKFTSFRRLNNRRLAFSVSIIFIAIVIAFIYYTFNLTAIIEHQEKQLVQLKDELEKNREILSVLQSRRIEVVIMNGLDVNPSGYGKIIWDPDRKEAILQISNLPPISRDKDYQLWLIKDNKPVSAGVFYFNEKDKQNFFKIEELVVADKKEINAFAVTLEPKGGVPQPTGAMYLLGQPL
jgi:anti-sigma-K factor RskA